MNSCIINIEQLLSYKVVTASYRKYQKKFSERKPNLKLPHIKLHQLEMQYASKKLSIDYKKLFKKEARHVAQNIADYKQNHPDRSQYAVYSTLTSRFHYIEYNSYTDLLAYRSHLNESYIQFENYLNRFRQIIADPKVRIKFYNKIKIYITKSLAQFEINPKKKRASHSHLPNYVRKDTLAVLKQYINDSFIPCQEISFNPCLCDFQDLQYCMGKKALLQVESIIQILDFTFNINNTPAISESCKKTDFSDPDKIKTELTVNQIAYFLRCLCEEKGILDEPNKMELFRKVTSLVRSTRQRNLSLTSIKNKYNMYDAKATDFWIEKFTHFLQFAKKERDNGHR